jgi:hypothetical protein
MKKMLSLLCSVVALLTAVGIAAPQPGAAQVDVFQNCSTNSGTAICKATSDKLFGPNSIWTKIINTLIYATGAVSALLIVLGGFRYAVSNGDQGNITSAKNTILYAIIGLVVAVSAYAIVNFVLSSI